MEQNDISSKIIHRLFYWNKNNRYVFSRTKFITILSILVCFINYLQMFGLIHSFLNGIIISIPVFIVGFVIHELMNIDSSFYNDNLSDNIKHFLFYWNDGANKFRLSKTKLITVILIVISLILGQRYGLNHNVVAGAPYGFIFAILALLVGYAIRTSKSENKNAHLNNYDKNINNNVLDEIVDKNYRSNLNNNKSNIPIKFAHYMSKTKKLKKEFDDKEIKTKELINAKFTPPQIAHDRFMAVLENCSKIFNEQYNATLKIISFANDDSIKVEDEIKSKINILESFIDKLDDLSNELVINMSKSKNEDIDDALDDMEKLIDSINEY